MDKIVKRNEKVAFMELLSEPDEFARMRGFTEFSVSKNPVEYSRKYIDEVSERNDVVSYSPQITYSFDKFSQDAVHTELAAIADDEIVGGDAVRSIIIVDMSATAAQKPAIKRDWAVIPDSEGNDKDTYTYSGTLKANGDIVKGTAASTDGWLTCKFTVAA